MIKILRAVIFDLDGVIINSEPLHAKVEMGLLQEFGVKVSEEEYYSFIGSTAEEMWQKLKNKYSLKEAVEELIKLHREKYVNYIEDNNVEPVNGVLEFINELNKNKLKLALASSTSGKIANTVLDKFHIREYFNAIVTGDEVPSGKSTPEIFLYTANILMTAPHECLVIEDSCSGANSAFHAGMKCIGIENCKHARQDLSKCNKIVRDFTEINFNIMCKLWG